MSITEVPQSYQVVTAMSALGAALRRNVWVDQVQWRVYPNLSVLLVGPSGIGKDVAINAAEKIIDSADDRLFIGGKTMEAIHEQLLKAGEPACAFITAAEITALLGNKDYQKGIVQELTNLLSTGDRVDVSLKSRSNAQKAYIKQPTVTMQAGSTAEWLHRAMPEGSLEGGFFPRFLIVCEEYNSRFVPLIKHSLSKAEREQAIAAKLEYIHFVVEQMQHYAAWPSEISMMPEAIDYYSGWYVDRFNKFSPVVAAYANRSRDQVLRLAMLCALSCGRNYIDLCDVVFADDIMQYVADTIEAAAVPQSRDAQVSAEVVKILPATNAEIIKTLSGKYNYKQILDSISMLMRSEQVTLSKDNGRFYVAG